MSDLLATAERAALAREAGNSTNPLLCLQTPEAQVVEAAMHWALSPTGNARDSRLHAVLAAYHRSLGEAEGVLVTWQITANRFALSRAGINSRAKKRGRRSRGHWRPWTELRFRRWIS